MDERILPLDAPGDMLRDLVEINLRQLGVMTRLHVALESLKPPPPQPEPEPEPEPPKPPDPKDSPVYQAVASMAQSVQQRLVGLYRQGLSGTVQEAQMQAELKMLSRELVAIMRPYLELMIAVTRRLREFLQGLDLVSQNKLMVGALSVGGLMAAQGLVGRFLPAGAGRLTSMATGGLAGSVLGAPGMLAGMLAGRYLATGLLTGAGAPAPAAPGPAGAPPGAGASTAAPTPAGAPPGAGASTAAAGGRGLLGVLGRVGPQALIVGGLAAAIEAATSDTYSRARQAGYSQLGAGLAHVTQSLVSSVGGITDLLGLTNTRAAMQRMLGIRPAETIGRRTAEIAGGGTQEIGAGFEAAAEAISRVQSSSADTVILRSIQQQLESAITLVRSEQTASAVRSAAASTPAALR